ncbi:MAG: YccF domain-containing protein [Acidobacteriota bacterium]
MALIGNIIWLIFGGLLSGLGYILGGLVLCLTIVGIPFGWANIKLGLATFAPFGKKVVEDDDANGCLTIVMNVIWLLLFGWEIALLHLIHALILAITIIGLPFAKQHIKLIPMALLPFGHRLEPA